MRSKSRAIIVKTIINSDTFIIGIIVPLPNHYISEKTLMANRRQVMIKLGNLKVPY